MATSRSTLRRVHFSLFGALEVNSNRRTQGAILRALPTELFKARRDAIRKWTLVQ